MHSYSFVYSYKDLKMSQAGVGHCFKLEDLITWTSNMVLKYSNGEQLFVNKVKLRQPHIWYHTINWFPTVKLPSSDRLKYCKPYISE